MKTKILEMMTALLVWLGLKKEETKALPYRFYATIYHNVADMTPAQRVQKKISLFKRDMTLGWKPYREMMEIATYQSAFTIFAYLEDMYDGHEIKVKFHFNKMAFEDSPTEGLVKSAWKQGKEIAKKY